MTPIDPRPAIEALDVTLPELMADLRAKKAEQRAVDLADYEYHAEHGDNLRWEPWEFEDYGRRIAKVRARFRPAGGASL